MPSRSETKTILVGPVGTSLREQEDRLLNLRLLDEINADTFARKQTELRDRISNVTLQLESADRGREEQADLAIRVFELSQALVEKWLASEYDEKRQLLEIVLLNCKLDGATLVPEMRKPFDVLVEGLAVSSSRGDRTPIELFRSGVQGLPATIRAALCQAATG